MKKAKAICIVLMLILALSACGDSHTVVQGVNNPYGGVFAIEEIENSPGDYVGNITLTGVVGDSVTQDFAIQNEDGTFEVLVDYRGSQALPQIGGIVVVEGQLRANRPCCGPGYTLISTQFEVAE